MANGVTVPTHLVREELGGGDQRDDGGQRRDGRTTGVKKRIPKNENGARALTPFSSFEIRFGQRVSPLRGVDQFATFPLSLLWYRSNQLRKYNCVRR